MRKLLFLAFMLPVLAFAQTNYEDVVYLKNGSIIHGVIIENVPNVSIKIKNTSGDVFVYKIEEIEKMTKEEPKQKSKPEAQAMPKPAWNFDNVVIKAGAIFEVGALFGVATNYRIKYFDGYAIRTETGKLNNPLNNMFDLKMIGTKMLTRNFSLGGGIIFDVSKQDAITANNPTTSIYLPVVVDIRYAFIKKRASPYVAVDAGGGFYTGSSDREYGGGATASLQFGVKVFVSKTVALNMALGYRFQHVELVPNDIYTTAGNYSTNNQYFMHYISLNWGIAF